MYVYHFTRPELHKWETLKQRAYIRYRIERDLESIQANKVARREGELRFARLILIYSTDTYEEGSILHISTQII